MSWDIIADRDIAYNYLRQHVPILRTEGQRGICNLHHGKIVAAVCYDDYSGHNVWMHVAAEPGRRWMTRWFLHEAFKFPFVTMGVSRITGWVEVDNSDAVRFNEHLGFTREATLRGAGSSGQDVILYVMHREDCRYA